MTNPMADDHDDRLARAERYVLGVERLFREQLALIEHPAARGCDTGREEDVTLHLTVRLHSERHQALARCMSLETLHSIVRSGSECCS